MGAVREAWAVLTSGLCVLPGFVDGHTHPVWAGDRVHEFCMKLSGATYMDIHKVWWVTVLTPGWGWDQLHGSSHAGCLRGRIARAPVAPHAAHVGAGHVRRVSAAAYSQHADGSEERIWTGLRDGVQNAADTEACF